MTVKDQLQGVLGLFEIEHCVPGRKNPEHNGQWGCAHISAHPYESAASTSDDHKILIRTPIYAFLDSMESSLSLELNKIN